ncbi:hypothetical protein RGQ15_02285 [Paracoccus sp. MBLB3053]|uniref:Uncharacterized protein n=1 Tax=Paracoccus aurantius TaxID=3073814 RepID=A0ABU2HMZ0_9RHOB|nr:hypothetical protein [Paracoccus sp. MBLB3053]MDS9466403.1 hypothetical protein [Paracoccus sp. MBLB3053]
MFNWVGISLAATLLLAGPVLAQDQNNVPYREKVNLKVGQAMVIHGKRGECGQLPPKSELKPIKFKTGHVQFGKPGTRMSNSCKGPTPVYEAIFVAERAGREVIELYGDPISITVK